MVPATDLLAVSLSSGSLAAGRSIADALAILLGIPTPTHAPIVFACQVRRETADYNADLSPGARFNDPLNLTVPSDALDPDHYWTGQTGRYSGGTAAEWHGDFAAFATPEAGAWACAANYLSRTYLDLQRAFRTGDPIFLAQAIQDSPWDSGHYGGTLVDEVRAELDPMEVKVTDSEFIEKYTRLIAEGLEQRITTAVDTAIQAAVNEVAKRLTATRP